MSELRKSKLASAMLCTLLFGGNAAGAMKKDMSKTISKNDLSTKDKELENRKPDDSGNPLLKYFLYFLGGAASVAKLADEGVGVAQAKNYIENKKLSPLGRLSIYKNLAARSYRPKTIETMRKLVAESYKNAKGIKQVFDDITGFLTQNPKGTKKVEGKNGIFNDIFDVARSDKYVDIEGIFPNIETNFEFESLSNYVKAVLGVSVKDCDKILVSTNKNNKYIAFVNKSVCLKLAYSESEKIMHFILCDNLIGFNSGDYSLDLDYGDYCFEITLPYMERVLGVKHDENYLNKVTNKEGSDKLNYSFYGQIFRDLLNDWKGDTPSGIEFMGQADKIFPDLFKKELKLIEG